MILVMVTHPEVVVAEESKKSDGRGAPLAGQQLE